MAYTTKDKAKLLSRVRRTWPKSRLFVEVTPRQEGILSSSRVMGAQAVIGSAAGSVTRNALVFTDFLSLR